MHSFWKSALAVSVFLFLAACGSDAKNHPAAAPPPPVVSVIEVQAEDVPIYNEYAAQTYSRDMVEVRGRVDGYIEKRLFQAGSDVAAGQVLFVLDLRPYQADVRSLPRAGRRSSADSSAAGSCRRPLHRIARPRP